MNLSVVIPAYRFARPEVVIASLLPLDPLEILVVDSSPQPPTLPDDPRVRLIRLPERSFPGRARNVGWQQARGDHVLFVDADIAFTEATRDFVRRYLAGDPPNELAFGLYNPTVPGDNGITRVLVAVQRYRFGEAWRGHTGRYGQSSHLIVRRDLPRRLGFFNPHLRIHEDKELCVRAANAGIPVSVYPEFGADHRKIYSLPALLRDHYEKTRLALRWRWQYPALFSRVTQQMGRHYQATWLLSFLAPFLLLAAWAGGLPGLVALPTLAAVWALPALLCRETFGRLRWRDQLTGVLVWPFMGGAMAVGAAHAALDGLTRGVRRTARRVRTLAVTAWRVLRRNGMPVNIVHFITARCNLRCEHCFYKDTLDAKDPGEQSLQQLDKTTREIGPTLWYALGGGEPFVRGDLATLVAVIEKNCQPLMLTIPTNGWYIEKTVLRTLEMLQQLDGAQLTLQLSLDGPPDIHDRIRGQDSWRRAEETFGRLRELQRLYPNLSLGIITVVTPDNAHVYPDFVDELVERFHPNQIAINLIRNTTLGGPPVPAEVIDAYKAAVDRYTWHIKQQHLTRLGYWGRRIMRAKEILQKELIYRVARDDAFVTPCTAGTLNYVIWENGDVAPCEVLGENIGNVLQTEGNNDFRDIISSDRARDLRRQIRDEQCRCTYECAMTVNTLFSWPMTRKMLKKTGWKI